MKWIFSFFFCEWVRSRKKLTVKGSEKKFIVRLGDSNRKIKKKFKEEILWNRTRKINRLTIIGKRVKKRARKLAVLRKSKCLNNSILTTKRVTKLLYIVKEKAKKKNLTTVRKTYGVITYSCLFYSIVAVFQRIFVLFLIAFWFYC